MADVSNWTLQRIQAEAAQTDHDAFSSLGDVFVQIRQTITTATEGLDGARRAAAPDWSSTSGNAAGTAMASTSTQGSQAADAATHATALLSNVYPTVKAATAHIASLPVIDTSGRAAVAKAGGFTIANIPAIVANQQAASAENEKNRQSAIAAFHQMDEAGANAAATFEVGSLFPTIPLTGRFDPTGLPDTMAVPQIGTSGTGGSGSSGSSTGSGGGGYTGTASRAQPSSAAASSGSSSTGGSGYAGVNTTRSAGFTSSTSGDSGSASTTGTSAFGGGGSISNPLAATATGFAAVAGGGAAAVLSGFGRPQLGLPNGGGSPANGTGGELGRRGNIGSGSNGSSSNGSGGNSSPGRTVTPIGEPEPSARASAAPAQAVSETELAASRRAEGGLMPPMGGGGHRRDDDEREIKRKYPLTEKAEDVFGDFEAGAHPAVIDRRFDDEE